jgi:hypothetical protein
MGVLISIGVLVVFLRRQHISAAFRLNRFRLPFNLITPKVLEQVNTRSRINRPSWWPTHVLDIGPNNLLRSSACSQLATERLDRLSVVDKQGPKQPTAEIPDVVPTEEAQTPISPPPSYDGYVGVQ